MATQFQFDSTDAKSDGNGFVRIREGRHKAIVKDIKQEFISALKNDERGHSGNVFNWVFEIYGSDVPNENNKRLFMNTPSDGQLKRVTTAVLYAVWPEYRGGSFSDTELIGRTCEVEVQHYKKRDGTESKYPTVKRVYPLIEAVGTLASYADWDAPQIKEGDVPF